PLKYAPELSWRERVRKWRRRHPRLAANGLMAVAVAVLLAAGTVIVSSALMRAHEGDRAIAQQTKECFVNDAQTARCFLNATIGERAPLREGLAFCEAALQHYGVLQRDDWQMQPAWQQLEQEERTQLTEDIRELLLLLARARVMAALH